MVSPLWATEAQTEYLQSLFGKYIDLNRAGDKNYTDFWATLKQGWLQRWPEQDVLYPGSSSSGVPLTEDQQSHVQDAIKERVKVLYSI